MNNRRIPLTESTPDTASSNQGVVLYDPLVGADSYEDVLVPCMVAIPASEHIRPNSRGAERISNLGVETIEGGLPNPPA